MSREDHREMQAEAYDDFRDYFKKHIAKGRNEHATLTDFGVLLKENRMGLDKMTIPLVHMETDDRGKVHELVKSFREGSYMEIKDNIRDDGKTFYAVIPWRTLRQKKKHSRRSRYDEEFDEREVLYEKPSQTRLTILAFAMMGIVAAAAFTTTNADWKLLFGNLV